MGEQPTWRWDDGGVVLTDSAGAPWSYKLRPLKARELSEYATELDTRSEILAVLRRARQQFELGGADYEGAVDRLRALVREYRRAEADVAAHVHALSTFFEPADLTRRLGESSGSNAGATFAKFLQEALPRLLAHATAD